MWRRAGVLLLSLGLAVSAAGCSLRAAGASAPRSAGVTGVGAPASAEVPPPAARVVPSPPPSAPSSPPPSPPYAVGRATFTFTEPAGNGHAARTLPTVLRYPATATGPLRSAAPFPLIVFSQGYDMPAESYANLLAAWAADGYVVADPTFPDTAPDWPGGPNEHDVVNHPRDVSFLIGQLLGMAEAPGGPLTGLIDPHHVGLAGHSDGGEVTLAVADNSCCRDPRVSAAVVLSGSELPAFGPGYFGGPPTPLLVAQGNADALNSPACSEYAYDHAPAPKYYLDLLGGTHTGPYLGSGRQQTMVAGVTADFFNTYLRGEEGAKTRLAGDATGSGVATITGAATVASTGRCPGY